jgi:hypothetical protein
VDVDVALLEAALTMWGIFVVTTMLIKHIAPIKNDKNSIYSIEVLPFFSLYALLSFVSMRHVIPIFTLILREMI